MRRTAPLRRSAAAHRSAAAAAPRDLAAERPAPYSVARLVPLDPGFYAFSLAGDTRRHETAAGLALPAVQVCALPYQGEAIEITDSHGRAGSWLGGTHRMLFVTAPAGGAAALLTAYLPPDPASPPLALEIRRVDRPAAPGRVITLGPDGSDAAPRSPPPMSLEIVAHIRGRGDVRFVDAPWIGRLQPGLWIEALTILPRDPSAAAIEYKGLTASGAETPWIASGSPCGTQGRGIALIGFAVRQKASAAGAALFDCDYTGYFASGATAGPARNGAPCRSAVADDPLEGIQLSIARRPAAAASGETA